MACQEGRVCETCNRKAESALDAVLSYLSTHADEWEQAAGYGLFTASDGHPGYRVVETKGLLAVLSHPETED